MLKQNTSPLPHFGVATVPDQIEGAIMPPIEENNCLLKSTSNSNSVKNPSILSSTYEPSSVSKTNNNSVSSPQNIESGTQANTEKKNVSKPIIHFHFYFVFIIFHNIYNYVSVFELIMQCFPTQVTTKIIKLLNIM